MWERVGDRVGARQRDTAGFVLFVYPARFPESILVVMLVWTISVTWMGKQ